MSTRVTTITAGRPASFATLLAELWAFRGLVWAFAARDLKVKYTQTVFGPLWVIANPLITVGVLTFVFGMLVKVPSDGLPYMVFYLAAIVPWNCFSTVLNQVTGSLESQARLISKIYFPRLVIAVAYALTGTFDFLVGYTVGCFIAAGFGVLRPGYLLLMPLLLAIQLAWALGLGLLLAPFNGRYRDVKYMLPLAVQLYYFATPVIYPVSLAPAWARWLYEFNPLAAVIDSYRAALGGRALPWASLGFSAAAAAVVLVLGAMVFMRREQDLVDVL